MQITNSASRFTNHVSRITHHVLRIWRKAMAKTAQVEVNDRGLLSSLQEFFRSVLESEGMNAMLVPRHLEQKNVIMPVLISDPEQLEGADPLAPAFPVNGARIVSKLTRKPSGGKIAVVLRPCEIRAFIELVKLKQARTDEILIIGMDCPGAYSNRDYVRFVEEKGEEGVARFCQDLFLGKGTDTERIELSPACQSCEFPIPEAADILIGLLGMDTERHFMVQALTQKGENLFETLGLSEAGEPKERQSAVESFVVERKACRDKMFAETAAGVNTLEKLTAYLSSCVNCYNCRAACPVCFCKECVFVTDVFDHDPSQYLKWAARKGAVKMPTDTLFYHITRLAHMSTACVGCGQCSNACPNDIPVAELFRTVSHRTQEAFDYEAGRSPDEAPPLSVFNENELGEVVGIN